MAREFQGVVVGAGPNGLAAALVLPGAGFSVLLLEGRATVGGGMRTAELTLPGFLHDVCSAVHPLARLSPFLQTLPLEEFGVEWVEPPVLAAHPLEDGSAAVLLASMEDTARRLGVDGYAYRRLVGELVPLWPAIVNDVLGPMGVPRHPVDFARFGLKALMPATLLAKLFRTRAGKGLFAGMAAHTMQPLSGAGTSAVALVLLAAGHVGGWPFAKGGTQSIADAMAAYFVSLGGTIETGVPVERLENLPKARVTMLDVSPRQPLQIAGDKLSPGYRARLERFRYGPGVFKMDWALDGPIPFTAAECRRAGTVHLGGTLEEIARSEEDANRGRVSERPFVLLAQPSLFDASRARGGKHTAWAYCHVPHGADVDMSAAIEGQIERFAPGFRERILARHAMSASELERYNPNYVGGDINGGAMNLAQMFARPVAGLSPYRTSFRGLYLCSASTPPGGGVHGMCGYHAAWQALHDQ